jgi:hypothetical protein
MAKENLEDLDIAAYKGAAGFIARQHGELPPEIGDEFVAYRAMDLFEMTEEVLADIEKINEHSRKKDDSRTISPPAQNPLLQADRIEVRRNLRVSKVGQDNNF